MSHKLSLALLLTVAAFLTGACSADLRDPFHIGIQSANTTDQPTTISDSSHPSGQPTQEGQGEGDLAELLLNGILSPDDSAHLADGQTVKALFEVAIESGEHPDSADPNDWTPVGHASSPDLSFNIYARHSNNPPPYLRDLCVFPYLRLTPVYVVERNVKDQPPYEYYQGPSRVQKCPGMLEKVHIDFPLTLQCQNCKERGGGELTLLGQLSDADSLRLSHENILEKEFGVGVETGDDPASDTHWTPVGKWLSPTLSITFSDLFGALPPLLSDLCFYSYLRIQAHYEVQFLILGITENTIQHELFLSPPMIQACPGPLDVIMLSLPLELKDTYQEPYDPTVQGH